MYVLLCLIYLPLSDLSDALDVVGVEWGWLEDRLYALERAIGARGDIPGKIWG